MRDRTDLRTRAGLFLTNAGLATTLCLPLIQTSLPVIEKYLRGDYSVSQQTEQTCDKIYKQRRIGGE